MFLDFRDIGAHAIAKDVLYFQFVPSIVAFLNKAALGTSGFIIVLILTLLFGRIYCSTLCPLGTLQDGIRFLIRKKKREKRKGFGYTPPHNFLRYSILIVTLLLFLFGSGFLLNLLDPFSSFGRILSNLIRPFVLFVNNLGASLLEPLGLHALYQVQWAVMAPLSVGVAVVMLIVTAWLSARYDRLYCNTVCPVGALLGLFSTRPLFRIGIDPGACTECGMCERVCKANCVDIQNRTIDLSRCVVCFNCLNACPGAAVGFKNGWRPTANRGRRGFLFSLAMGGMGMAVNVVGEPRNVIQSRPTTVPVTLTCPVSPPGSGSIAHFTSQCTACHLCVSTCPSRVLVPSFLEYGLSGMMQPRMNFHSGHCNYDCTACLEVCPSGAILPMTREEKQRTQLGVAKFIKENCVVYTDNTNCGACSEHCPTKAVHMVPYLNAAGRQLVIPKVTPDICVGCGGCEYACPTKPYKAIYVDGNSVHRQAQKPTINKIEQKIDADEDFPF